LDPDPYWIRIDIQPKMLDPDPDEINADPQPWLLASLLMMASRLMMVFLLLLGSCICMTIFHYLTLPSTDDLLTILKDWKVRQICQFNGG
jgi:hypothetical protein